MKLLNLAYIRNVFLSAFIFLMIVAGINVVVNPYGFFPVPAIAGFNEVKPEFDVNLPRSKAAVVRYVEAEAVIFGTSRAEQGYNPEHPGFQGDISPVFNLASPSSTMYRMYRMFQHAQYNHPIKREILALDFLSFNIYQNDGNVDSFADVSYSGKPQPFAHLNGIIPSILSFKALNSSVFTLKNQDLDKVKVAHFLNGFKYKNGRVSQQRKFYLKNCARFVRSVYFPAPKKEYEFADKKTGRSSFTYFRDFVAAAYENNIDLRMVINPPHAYLLEVIAQSGLWDKYEKWKKTLVEINEEEARRAGVAPFPLWDFSGYNSVSTQLIPAKKSENSDEFYYYESSHFKESVGDMMMDRVFDYHHPGRSLPEDFGVLLTSASIQDHLTQTRAQQAIYRQEHAEEVQDVANAIKEPLKEVRKRQ